MKKSHELTRHGVSYSHQSFWVGVKSLGNPPTPDLRIQARPHQYVKVQVTGQCMTKELGSSVESLPPTCISFDVQALTLCVYIVFHVLVKYLQLCGRWRLMVGTVAELWLFRSTTSLVIPLRE